LGQRMETAGGEVYVDGIVSFITDRHG